MSSGRLRQPPPLLDCPALFRPLHARLMEVLDTLDGAGWDAPTTAGAWRVRDVAAHLLDGDLRKLSFHRDGLTAPRPEVDIAGFTDLVGHLDGLNREWVEAARRLSPRVLRELLQWSGAQVAAFVSGLDPMGEALFPVAWAGEERSLVWMDTAREYTERWHHQQQIRAAVSAPLLEEPRFLRPVIEASVRALPRAYAGVEAPAGTCVAVEIMGESGGTWTVRREDARWVLYEGRAPEAAAAVTMDQRFAWRLLLKALPAAERRGGLGWSGDARLAQRVGDALAVMG